MFPSNQERKLGDQKWLDTIVVLTINYAILGLESDNVLYEVFSSTIEKLKSLGSGGSMRRKSET